MYKISSRRQFFQLLGGASLLPLSACRTLSSQEFETKGYGPSGRVRRSVWSLTPAENGLLDYEKAVAILKGLPPSDYRSWINIAGVHRDSCPHGNSLFFPWHRAYLDYLEKICSQVLGKPFSLPYWDWSTHSGLPPEFLKPESALFHEKREIKAGKTMQDLFKEYDPQAEDPWSKKAVDHVQSSSNFLNYTGRAKVLPNIRTHDQVKAQRQVGFGTAEGAVAGGLETGAHNLTHVYVGGDMNDMMSPLDPIFWVHHSNVDRLWSEWCHKNPTRIIPTNPEERAYWLNFQLIGIYYETKLPDIFATHGPYRVAFTKLVHELLTTERLGYRYDTTVDLPAILVADSLRDQTSKEESLKPLILEVETRGVVPKIQKNVVTFDIALSDQGFQTIQKMLARFEARKGQDVSFSLQAIGLPEPQVKRGMIEFYIDHPSLTPPAIKASFSPHFVGRVGFFGHAHEGSVLSVSYDLSQVVQNLRKTGWKLSQNVRLQMVFRGKLLATASQFQTTKLRLEYIEMPLTS